MDEKRLRSGYTTGTCAAAAAKAAAVFLLTGRVPDTVHLVTPAGIRGEWNPRQEDGWFCVSKDAGDDPDVTHGVWVYGRVEEVGREAFQRLKETGQGYEMETCPRLYLTGGTGIGIVTRPGLSCPVGKYAINPVPRRMILSEVEAVCRGAAYDGYLKITIMIPAGVGLAQKTFNPRLGIAGGISVLGTTGIVKPMSEEALVETIRLDIRVRAAMGRRMLLMAPGNYGETFLEEQMGVPSGAAVLCSNFVRQSICMLVEEGVRKLLFVGHIGKLIKVSAGAANTHSRYGDGRMEELARLSACCAPDDAALWKATGACNTTDEAVGMLREKGLAEAVLSLAAEQVKHRMESWADGKLEIQVMTFSLPYGILGKTKQAEEFLAEWKRQEVTGQEEGV